MSFARPTKQVLAIATTSTTNGATTTGLIDTLGFAQCSLAIHMTTADSTTNKMTTLKISESDDTVVTNFADVTALVGGGAGGFTMPTPNTTTTTPNLVNMSIDLRKRKRYLKITATPPTTQSITAWATLHHGAKAPATAAEAGGIALVEA